MAKVKPADRGHFPLVIGLSVKAMKALEEVWETGLYGETLREVAERIICQELEHRFGLGRFLEREGKKA